jgi:hypothetical protein
MTEEEYLAIADGGDATGGILIVKLGQKGKEAGLFVCEDANFSAEKLVAVPIKFTEGCVCFSTNPDHKFSKDDVPICKSDNGRTPAAEIENPLCGSLAPGAEPCKAVYDKATKKMVKPCDYGNFHKDGDNFIRPVCGDNRNILFVNMETFDVFWIIVAGSGLSYYWKFKKKIDLMVRRLNRMRVSKGKSAARYGMLQFDLGAEFKETKSGEFYIPTFSNIKNVEFVDEEGEFDELNTEEFFRETGSIAYDTRMELPYLSTRGDLENEAGEPGEWDAAAEESGKF